MADIKVGDEVRVFNRNRYHQAPDGGWVGAVTKVGRKYATVTYEVVDRDLHNEPQTFGQTVEFDMETGYEKGTNSSYGRYVMTPEQLERAERQKTALFLLAERGIEVKRGYANSLTLEQIEALAEVVKNWEN